MNQTRETVAELGARGLLRAVLNTSEEGLIVTDSFGRVLLVNKSAEQLLGFAVAEGESPHWSGNLGFELSRVDEPGWTREDFLVGALRGQAMAATACVLRVGTHGAPLPVLVSALPVQLPTGQVRGAVLRLRPGEITPATPTKAADEAWDLVSRDLPASLRAAENLARQALSEDLDPEFRRDALEDLLVLVQQLSGEAADVLWITKQRSGDAAPRIESVPAAGLLADACGRAFRLLEQSSQYAVWSSDPVDLSVQVDPALLARSLATLIATVAREAGPATRIDVRAAKQGRTLLFVVKGEGYGLAGAAADAEPRAVRFGRSVARSHGGELSIETAPGGDTITLSIPQPPTGLSE